MHGHLTRRGRTETHRRSTEHADDRLLRTFIATRWSSGSSAPYNSHHRCAIKINLQLRRTIKIKNYNHDDIV